MAELDLDVFRKLLEAKHHDLLLTSSSREGLVIENTADEIDMLQQQLNREIVVRSLDHKSKLLKSLQAALDRIEDEIYGGCLRCEEPIAEKRLRAVPWALFCVGCQEIVDRAYDEDGDTIEFAA